MLELTSKELVWLIEGLINDIEDNVNQWTGMPLSEEEVYDLIDKLTAEQIK